jgi:hypothetical protein
MISLYATTPNFHPHSSISDYEVLPISSSDTPRLDDILVELKEKYLAMSKPNFSHNYETTIQEAVSELSGLRLDPRKQVKSGARAIVVISPANVLKTIKDLAIYSGTIPVHLICPSMTVPEVSPKEGWFFNQTSDTSDSLFDEETLSLRTMLTAARLRSHMGSITNVEIAIEEHKNIEVTKVLGKKNLAILLPGQKHQFLIQLQVRDGSRFSDGPDGIEERIMDQLQNCRRAVTVKVSYMLSHLPEGSKVEYTQTVWLRRPETEDAIKSDACQNERIVQQALARYLSIAVETRDMIDDFQFNCHISEAGEDYLRALTEEVRRDNEITMQTIILKNMTTNEEDANSDNTERLHHSMLSFKRLENFTPGAVNEATYLQFLKAITKKQTLEIPGRYDISEDLTSKGQRANLNESNISLLTASLIPNETEPEDEQIRSHGLATDRALPESHERDQAGIQIDSVLRQAGGIYGFPFVKHDNLEYDEMKDDDIPQPLRPVDNKGRLTVSRARHFIDEEYPDRERFPTSPSIRPYTHSPGLPSPELSPLLTMNSSSSRIVLDGPPSASAPMPEVLPIKSSRPRPVISEPIPISREFHNEYLTPRTAPPIPIRSSAQGVMQTPSWVSLEQSEGSRANSKSSNGAARFFRGLRKSSGRKS